MNVPPSSSEAALRFVAKALGALSAFILLYVAYAHLASITTAREYEAGSRVERFTSTAALPSRFDVSGSGEIALRVEDNHLHLVGVTSHGAALSALTFADKPQRLDDTVWARLRFRVKNRAPYDVGVGLERVAPAKDDVRRLLFAMHNGASGPVSFGLSGDGNVAGRRGPVANDWPNGRDGAAIDDPRDWHEISLRLSAYLKIAAAYVDGKQIGSTAVKWLMGAPVRLVFGVYGREPGAPIDLEIDEARYEIAERTPQLAGFTEQFDGKYIDPRRWILAQPDGWAADSQVRTVPGEGLSISTEALHVDGFSPGAVLHSQPMPLRSFHASARFSVSALRRGALILGMVGTGYSPQRAVDVGIADTEAGRVGFVAGHWDGGGQLRFLAFPKAWTGQEGTVELGYDSESGIVRAWINGDGVLDKPFDVRPFEDIELRVGANLHEAGSKVVGTIKEVRYEPR